MIKQLKHRNIIVFVFFAVFWFIAAILVNPIGDFPINDDWSYNRTLYDLDKYGTLNFTGWYSMTIVSQIFFTLPFVKIFGFSFTLTRILTLSIAFIGIVANFYLLKNIIKNKFLLYISILFIAFNPFILSQSFTFMTDIWFFSFSSLTTLCFFNYLKTNKFIYFIVALFLSIFTTYIRQMGIFIPLGIFIMSLFYKEYRSLKKILTIILPFLLCFLALYFYNIIFPNSPDVSQTDKNNLLNLGYIWNNFLERYYVIFPTLALFLLPFIFLGIRNYINNFVGKKGIFKNKEFVIFSLVSFFIILLYSFIFLDIYKKFPNGNIFYNFGLTPILLKDAYSVGIGMENIKVGNAYWSLICGTGVLAGLLLIINFVIFFLKLKKTIISSNRDKNIYGKLKLFSIIYFISFAPQFVLFGSFYDRYVIPLIVPTMIIIFAEKINLNKFFRYFFIIFVSITIIFSVFATKDSLSIRRTELAAVSYLLKNKVKKADIEGSFEYDGWNNMIDTWLDGYKLNENSFIYRKEYILAKSSNIDNYKTIKSFSYFRLIPVGMDSIFVMKRIKSNRQFDEKH